MPAKTGPTLKDPVGAIARNIARVGSDYRFGKPGTSDFVREARRVLALPPDDEMDERLAETLFDDAGEKYETEYQMAAFLYAEMTR